MTLRIILILAFTMVLLFSLDTTVSAFNIEEVIMIDSGMGLKVTHLVSDLKVYGVPGYDWDNKEFCSMWGGEYGATKDLTLCLNYCEWPLERAIMYSSAIVLKKQVYTAEAKFRQGNNFYEIGLSSGELRTEKKSDLAFNSVGVGYKRNISMDGNEKQKTFLLIDTDFAWADSEQEYLSTEAKLIIKRDNFTVLTGLGHNTYTGNLKPYYDLSGILRGFSADKVSGLSMFILAAEQKIPLMTVSAEDFKGVYSLPFFIELAGIGREEESFGRFSLHNRIGLGLSFDANKQVEIRLDGVLLDGTDPKIVFYANTEVY